MDEPFALVVDQQEEMELTKITPDLNQESSHCIPECGPAECGPAACRPYW